MLHVLWLAVLLEDKPISGCAFARESIRLARAVSSYRFGDGSLNGSGSAASSHGEWAKQKGEGNECVFHVLKSRLRPSLGWVESSRPTEYTKDGGSRAFARPTLRLRVTSTL